MCSQTEERGRWGGGWDKLEEVDAQVHLKMFFWRLQQANLNPALWDMHKLWAWGVVAVSSVLCILV